MFNASLWGRVAAASLGCKVVVAEHSTEAKTPLAERLTNILLRSATESVIACAEAQVEPLARGGHQRRKIHVVRNGVSVGRFARDDQGAAKIRADLGVPPDAAVVMLVAAHRTEKRHDRFISLIERLHGNDVHAWGVMVGGGPLLERTAALAKASPVSEWLRVAGPIMDMPAAYSAADVVVLVTDVETFPLCFLEAQACEVPVVGMDPGGIRETLVEGQTGFVVEQGDIRAMESVTAALLSDRVWRKSIGRAGRTFVQEHLSTDAMVDGYARVLAGQDTGERTAE
jgi:glycosyltransferase involved in cell wall biosynthesis